jgi:hypothetical protein
VWSWPCSPSRCATPLEKPLRLKGNRRGVRPNRLSWCAGFATLKAGSGRACPLGRTELEWVSRASQDIGFLY